MLDTKALFRLQCPSGNRLVYVSKSGSDTFNGLSPTTAKYTIQAAIDNCQAGDRILVDAGTYDYGLFYNKQGTSSAWITLEPMPGTSPVIDVSNSVASYDSTKLNNGMDFQLSAYVGLYGFEIRGNQLSKDNNPSGVGIFRGSHHISVYGCDIHDFPGGGINCFYIGSSINPSDGTTLPAGGWDAVDIFFNKIHATSKYNPYNTSGISFYGGESLTSLVGGYGYRAVGNYIYDVICTVPYTPGGFTNVTDGNGISPDSLAVANSLYPSLQPYLKRGLIEGNVIAGCGGRGVHIYNSKNVDVFFNTFVGNLRTNSPYINGSTEVDVALDTPDANNGCNITGNVFLPLNTTKTLDTVSQTIGYNVVLGGTDTVTGTNINQRSTGIGWLSGLNPAQILQGVSISQYAPQSAGSAPKPTSVTGYQALAFGGRMTANWTSGALEPVVAARAFR